MAEPTSSASVVIYGLSDPRSGCLRYIGQTKRLKKRLSRHCNPAENDRSHRGCWLRGLHNAGLEPQLIELEEVPSELAAIVEAFWIASLRAAGACLVNTTDGEQAPSRRGFTLTLKHRAKIAASHLGIRPAEGTLEKMKWTPERRAKMEAAYALQHPRHIKKHGGWAAYGLGCRCVNCITFVDRYYERSRQANSVRPTSWNKAAHTFAERKARALELANANGHVSCVTLSEKFGSAPHVYRRPIESLVAEGVLRTAGCKGYALIR